MAPERVDLLPLTAGNVDHLAMYAHMDISLDPFPYAGTTTTCESLFMGVPVVSLAGKRSLAPSHAARSSTAGAMKHERSMGQIHFESQDSLAQRKREAARAELLSLANQPTGSTSKSLQTVCCDVCRRVPCAQRGRLAADQPGPERRVAGPQPGGVRPPGAGGRPGPAQAGPAQGRAAGAHAGRPPVRRPRLCGGVGGGVPPALAALARVR